MCAGRAYGGQSGCEIVNAGEREAVVGLHHLHHLGHGIESGFHEREIGRESHLRAFIFAQGAETTLSDERPYGVKTYLMFDIIGIASHRL